MAKTDYNKLMQEQISTFGGERKKLLLHACCAPCSSACLERLYPYFDVTVFFYNPNIEDEEYLKRKEELKRFIKETEWATFLDCDHEKELFYSTVKGMENEPEGGKRCLKCFYLRLEKTAREASVGGYDYFATTLTVSPLKNAEAINKIGVSLQTQGGAKWLYSDFKKGNGYLRSLQLSKEHSLYRQNYCGCVYSQKPLEK
jgi:hypothetical protein